MPGMGEYMAGMDGGGQAAPSAAPMSLGNAGQQLQPDYGSKEAEQTPLNDRVYHGGELSQILKRLLIERQQARAAASAQYQRGQMEKNLGQDHGLPPPPPPQPPMPQPAQQPGMQPQQPQIPPRQ